MRSLAARYDDGEWDAVWAQIRQMGHIPPARRTEVEDVASTTMRKAAVQIRGITDRLLALGFEPAAPGVPLITPPPPDVAVRLQTIETIVGPLPAALKASIAEIGAVSLLGDLPGLGVYYHGVPARRMPFMPPGPGYPDPLYLPGIDSLEWEIRSMERDPADMPQWDFPFAPDELHKANISGGTHDLRLPADTADPALIGVAGRPGITLVEYLKLSVSWGGFPGYAFNPTESPPALEQLKSPAKF